MTSPYEHGIYEDGEWCLGYEADTAFFLDYWLTHFCQKSKVYEHRWGSELERPCRYCGSVCPPGLRGMYLTLAML